MVCRLLGGGASLSMLHEAPVPKDATKGVRSTPNPGRLWHCQNPKFKNGSKVVVELRAAGNWLPKIVVEEDVGVSPEAMH